MRRPVPSRSAAAWSIGLTAALLGCGGAPAPDPAQVEADAAAAAELAAEEAAAIRAAEAKARIDRLRPDDGKERAKLATTEGEVRITATLNGTPAVFTVPVEQASFRVGHLPTLEFPIGHVKLDSTRATHPDNTAWADAVVKYLFTSYGTPIQLFIDVSSVSEMVGVLDAPGKEAAGLVLAGVQVDDRKLEVEFGASFTRAEAGGLTINVPTLELTLADLGMDDRIAKFVEKSGARLGPKIVLSADLDLPPTDAVVLPNFVRVPVTVQRTREIQLKVDAEVDSRTAAIARLRAAGLPASLIERISEDQLDKARANMNSITNRRFEVNLGEKLDARERRLEAEGQ